MVKISTKGDFKLITKFLNALNPRYIFSKLDKYGKIGVEALRQGTPKRFGRTAASWDYVVDAGKESASIVWTNSHVNKGVHIALMIQYGHGMPHGGYVQGVDYINPALEPIFDEILDKLWKEIGV